MDISTADQITQLLEQVGQRSAEPAEIYLFGGSALLLLGGRRSTVDIDFTLRGSAADALRRVIASLAVELDLDLEESSPEESCPCREAPTNALNPSDISDRSGHTSLTPTASTS